MRRAAAALALRGGQIWSSHNMFLERECGQRVKAQDFSLGFCGSLSGSCSCQFCGRRVHPLPGVLSCGGGGRLSTVGLGGKKNSAMAGGQRVLAEHARRAGVSTRTGAPPLTSLTK